MVKVMNVVVIYCKGVLKIATLEIILSIHLPEKPPHQT